MYNVKKFIKNISLVTKILVAVWVFFSIVGAGFDASQFKITFPLLAIIFIIPAIIVEYKKNPIWKKYRSLSVNSQAKKEIVSQLSPFENGVQVVYKQEVSSGMQSMKVVPEKASHSEIDYDDNSDDDYFDVDLNDVSSVDGMDGHEFEYFCAELLRVNGFDEVRVTPGSGDQGVDILAEKGGVKYAIQCKNYFTPLGNKPVQEVNAGRMFYNCHVGVVMTNSTFTPGAKELAKATGVLLWGRDILQELMDEAE